jgi:SAM-dependent methyltransferase
VIQRRRRTRAPRGGRLQSLGQDFDRGHREYVGSLEPGNALWLRTKPFSAPPNFELLACLRTFSHVIDQLGLGLRAQVLDVGCGPGWMSEFLARCGYWVTGIDISEDMVQIARDRVNAIGGPVAEGIEAQAEFHAMHVRDIAWENRFDAAVLYDTMHHFDDEVETLRVILRSLVPGGRIYIREGVRPLPGSESERALVAEMEQYGTLESPFDPEYLRWSVEDAGFVDVKQLVEVDELMPLDDASRPLRLLANWARIRTGRRRPETNTLIGSKPLADMDAAQAWRGRLSVAGHVKTDADGTIRVPLRVENTGRAFWPAPTAFPYAQGIVTVAPYVVDGGARVELPRAALPRSLGAGGTVDVEIAVPREQLGERRELFVDLVREGITWFSAPEAPIAVVRIDDA